MHGLDFGHFHLNLNLNFDKEVKKSKDLKLKFNLTELWLSIALLTDIAKLHE